MGEEVLLKKKWNPRYWKTKGYILVTVS